MKKKVLGIVLALALMFTLVMPVLAAGDVPYYDVQVVDVDANADGVVNLPDFAAFANAYGSEKGDPNYDRQFDMNFDDNVDFDDFVRFADIYGAELSTIQAHVKTGSYRTLWWRGDDWKCLLSSVSPYSVAEFTGTDFSTGWISVVLHSFSGQYDCDSFAFDTQIASYKALGYGCILQAHSSTHAYNVFWKGGDWQNLHNWGILEPQTGQVLVDAANVPSDFRTQFILLPDNVMGICVYYHALQVNYANASVSYYAGSHSSPLIGLNLEEPVPSTFNKFLGQGDD